MAIKLRPIAPIALAAVFVLGGCSSDRDAVGSTPITAVGTGGGGTGEVANDESVSGGPIEGSWVAEASELLATGTGGGFEGLSCEGLVTLVFFEGNFNQSGEAECSLRDQAGTLVVMVSGEYSLDGTTLTVASVDSTGSGIQLGEDLYGLSFGLEIGEATYSISGDTLAITSGTTASVTQVYTRSN